MEKVILFLVKLNNKLYSFIFHTPVLILWIWGMINFQNGFITWLKIGLGIWFALILFRLHQDKWNVKEHLKGLWQMFRKKGILPFIVGLNITVVLSLASIPIVYLLAKYMRDDESKVSK